MVRRRGQAQGMVRAQQLEVVPGAGVAVGMPAQEAAVVYQVMPPIIDKNQPAAEEPGRVVARILAEPGQVAVRIPEVPARRITEATSLVSI